MPTKVVVHLRLFLLLAIVGQGVSACSGDATAPTAMRAPALQPPTLAPAAASHALVGATDGEYVFTIDPKEDQSLEIGPNHLDIPADAICKIDDSSYGPDVWDAECKPQRGRVTITATVRNADGDQPRIDFEPALRFAPDKTVMLYMTLDQKANRKEWSKILYCATLDTTDCVDEAKGDRSLATSVNDRVVFRRIKHFSGYIVLSREE